MITLSMASRLPETPRTPEWSRAEPVKKLGEAYSVIYEMGGKVFTLRFGKNFHDQIVSHEDPCRFVSRRIQKECQRRGVQIPLLAFALEVTPDDRNELHMHGAFCLEGVSSATANDLMRDACGRISGRAGSRQLQIKAFDLKRGGPSGWASYCLKRVTRTRRVIQNDRVVYISTFLRSLSQSRWESRSRAGGPYIS
jgi:hypothetical protein